MSWLGPERLHLHGKVSTMGHDPQPERILAMVLPFLDA